MQRLSRLATAHHPTLVGMHHNRRQNPDECPVGSVLGLTVVVGVAVVADGHSVGTGQDWLWPVHRVGEG